ncbi:MAG: phospholipid carrier-dependent glycosyltransferase [Candidatus Peregrinibacteria bacterium]
MIPPPSPVKSDAERRKREGILLFVLVGVLSYFTFVHHYASPAAFFWDENYHIASAQKYLNGIMFMEQHPPLGKMLIALGEKIVNANPADNQFIGTDYAKDPPAGFSFAGYRLFPVLLAWWTAPVLFLIFLLLSRRAILAALMSFLYVFDNALIVHARGAMLEGTLLFFTALTILAFFLMREWKDRPKHCMAASFLFGIAFGAAFMTKLTGLILILLIPALLFVLWPRKHQFFTALPMILLGFFAVFCAVWWLHFSIGTSVSPTLSNSGYYEASAEYKAILGNGSTASLASFPILLRDSIAFVGKYNRGVPRLDLCKPDENGSPFYLWPFGGRSINYRWETPDGNVYRYLYLQVNPVIWWSATIGVFLAAAMFLLSFLVPFAFPLKNRLLIGTFLALYSGYMLTMARMTRVMYLYHYFVPLLFSFVLLALVLLELRQIGRWVITEQRRTTVCFVLALFALLSFQFYRPFTYYEPMTDNQVMLRAMFPYWELHCVKCAKVSPVAVPRTCEQK